MDDEELLAGLRTADERAMYEFVARYRAALERIATGAIAPVLRARITPDSVAQSVCRTFLRRMDDSPYRLEDADALWSLLCAIAFTKVRERVRFHRRQKRSTEREVPLAEAHAVTDPGQGPVETVAFQDALQQLLTGLGDEERRVLVLRLEGRTQQEVAADVGCSERTVRRLLKSLEVRLRAQLVD